MYSILAAADLLIQTFKAGGKVLLCGNGGSAADCQHMAAELVPAGLPAIALTTDTSFITAWSNDVSFTDIFAAQIDALEKPEDTLLAISTSGQSANILSAVESATCHTIALTGTRGVDLVADADVTIMVPSTNTEHIQEAHLAIEHILCNLVKKAMNDN